MARELKLSIWCDLCQHEDKLTEGEELPAVTYEGRSVVLALCAPHKVERFDPFVDLLAVGVPAETLVKGTKPLPATNKAGEDTPSKTAKFACTECGTVLKGRYSLFTHLRNQHDKTAHEAYGDSPIVDVDGNMHAPAQAATPEADQSRVYCDQPGCRVFFEGPKNTRPMQAMAIHRTRNHNVRTDYVRQTEPAESRDPVLT